MGNNPLGRTTDFVTHYDPGLLHAVARHDARAAIGITAALPFQGYDIWNAWELSWVNDDGKPVTATACLQIPAESPNIVESKSLKLYLGSFAMTPFATAADVVQRMRDDLSQVAGCGISLALNQDVTNGAIGHLPGGCIDALEVDCSVTRADASLLEAGGGETVFDELHSHLFRSLCPVTNQPDSGSILIRYRGSRIEPSSLLRYLLSFREHNDFHEACIERIFVDLKRRCAPDQLTVYARYNRRGGIDINPFRSDFEDTIANTRLWRQ